MIVRVACAALHGVDAFRVDLEVDLARQGMPAFVMVGLAEGALRESRERVFAAMRACNLRLPPARITVNLAPADRRKSGSGFDLPLAIGLLAAAEILPQGSTDGWFLLGELSLTGELKPVPGVLPVAVRARAEGARGMLVAADNAAEAAVVEGLPVYPVRSLGEAAAFLAGQADISAVPSGGRAMWERGPDWPVDFAEVKGQEHAKRAIEIAAAGAHNLLFIGPPGSGKTMLAQRIPTVLPPLSFEEALDVTTIYSVAGQLDGQGLITRRPFRAPHHTVSDYGLVGGGANPRPGEISLAHRGVLFLDELPEFRKTALEVMRQPLEDGVVTIARAAVSLTYPADSMLVAAMNPCPCGYRTDDRHTCTCLGPAVQRYRARLSGPLLDRIDLHVEVPAVPYEDLRGGMTGSTSAEMRDRIGAARAVQSARYAGTPCRTNADLTGKLLEEHCALGQDEHAFLEGAVRTLALSARAYTRILRIARTIADLEHAERVLAAGQVVGQAAGQEIGRDDANPAAAAVSGAGPIGVAHLAEAINCRALDRERL
mgnify:CR=1 FL=1